jgi:ribose transport system permease protein
MTDTAAPAPEKSGPRISGAFHRLLAFSGLIALVVAFSLASPNFMQTQNILAILQATSVNGVLAIAATLVIITGGIDLSVGTLMTFCAVIAGVILTFLDLPLPLGVIGAILAGTLSGLISGTVVAKLKVPPFIATLGMMLILKACRSSSPAQGRSISTTRRASTRSRSARSSGRSSRPSRCPMA